MLKKIKIILGIIIFILAAIAEIELEHKNETYKPIVSSWNGVPYAVTDFLKENLKDPSSLEIIKSYEVYQIDNEPDSKDKKYYQKTTYRAKNSFGGYVVETKTFVIQNNKVIGVI